MTVVVIIIKWLLTIDVQWFWKSNRLIIHVTWASRLETAIHCFLINTTSAVRQLISQVFILHALIRTRVDVFDGRPVMCVRFPLKYRGAVRPDICVVPVAYYLPPIGHKVREVFLQLVLHTNRRCRHKREEFEFFDRRDLTCVFLEKNEMREKCKSISTRFTHVYNIYTNLTWYLIWNSDMYFKTIGNIL